MTVISMTAAAEPGVDDPVRRWQARIARRALSPERWVARTTQLIELTRHSHIAELAGQMGDYAFWIGFTARHPDAVIPSLLSQLVEQFARLTANLGRGQEHDGNVLRALDEAIALQLRLGAATTDLFLAKAAYLRAEHAESPTRLAALRAAVAHAKPGSSAWGDAMIAICWYRLDVSHYRSAIRAARAIRELGDRYACASLAWEGVARFTSLHNLDRAEGLLRQACRHEDRIDADPEIGQWVAMAYHYLARIAELRGHHRTSMELYLCGQRIAASNRESLHADTFEQLRIAELLMAAGLFTPARDHLDRAYALVRTFSDRSSARLQVDLGYATLQAATGDPRQAVRAIHHARRRARSVGFWRGELLCHGYLLALTIRLRAFRHLPGLAIGILASALGGELRRNSLPKLIARIPVLLRIAIRRMSGRRRTSRTPEAERLTACACDLHA